MVKAMEDVVIAEVEGPPIDRRFDAAFASELARLESYNRHHYRPNSYLHKWWARRCGSTFRLILKHLVQRPAQQDYYSAGGLEGKTILDPMMGGGTTLHEAIRLGANVIGADIDPIPILQARATLSRLPLPRLESAYDAFFSALRDVLAPYYRTNCPECDLSADLRYVLHGLRRRCDCREVIVVDSLILRHDSNGSIVHLDPETHDIYRNNSLIGKSLGGTRPPILDKGERRCDRCDQGYRDEIALPYYQRYLPLAIVGQCERHGQFFIPPTQHDLNAIEVAEEQRSRLAFDPADFIVHAGPKSQSLVDRGVESYLDLFTSRQLLYLRTSMMLLADLEPLIRLNLSLLVSTSLEFNSMLCGYKGDQKIRPGAIRHTFAYHAYSFPYTALENNPVWRARASGTLENLFRGRIQRGRTWALNPIERRIRGKRTETVAISGETDMGTECSRFGELGRGQKRFLLMQRSSVSLELPDGSVDYIVTDPPYFDSVQYSDLAAFFRVWLRQLLPREAAWDYAADESAVNQHRSADGQYASILSDIFRECHRVLKQAGRLIFTFHHWKARGWSALTIALRRAGFVLVNRYVVHAENRASIHIVNQRALLHDVILVLAPIEAGGGREWRLPEEINRANGQEFCQACGTIVGWMLDQTLTESEIEARWRSLLE